MTTYVLRFHRLGKENYLFSPTILLHCVPLQLGNTVQPVCAPSSSPVTTTSIFRVLFCLCPRGSFQAGGCAGSISLLSQQSNMYSAHVDSFHTTLFRHVFDWFFKGRCYNEQLLRLTIVTLLWSNPAIKCNLRESL